MRWVRQVGIGIGGLLALAGLVGGVVARLAGRDPGPGPDGLKFAVNEALYPFTHHFASLPNGTRVHYLDEGPERARETIVFLHGNPTWSFLYRNIVRSLRGDYRCIALDYPGFGLSEAPQGYDFLPRTQSQSVEQFFDALGLRGVRRSSRRATTSPRSRRACPASPTAPRSSSGARRMAVSDRQTGRASSGAFPRHRTVVLETAKHFIQEDEPGRIAAEIRDFLRGPLS